MDHDKEHSWRRDPSWWDELEVPTGEKDVFRWLESEAPDPTEHDYILSTDGSGCSKGWGGYAAVAQKVERIPGSETRGITKSWSLVSGTYGSSVQRCEFGALLDGVYSILSSRCEEIKDEAAVDEAARYKIGSEGALNQIRGLDRLTILWYTDRETLAKSLLYDEEGDPLYSHNKERDLWMRWAFMSTHVCITPMGIPRNSVAAQDACDKLAGRARRLMMDSHEEFAKYTKQFHPIDLWQTKKSQKAQF